MLWTLKNKEELKKFEVQMDENGEKSPQKCLLSENPYPLL